MRLGSSNLREVSNNESPKGVLEGALRDAVRDKLVVGEDGSPLLAPQSCTLGVHDSTFSKLDVLVNASAFSSKKIPAGTRLRILAQDADSPQNTFKRRTSSEHGPLGQHRRNSTRHHDAKVTEISYVFVAQELPPEILARHPTLEISITQRIATALGFKNRSRVTVTLAEEEAYAASHVEIAFRDAYLTRADMWRLVVSELAGKSMYKGQKITFMNTIKAQIKTIHHRGAKAQSAFFGYSTKPIFRSESARYVLFIQMSREMWAFDTDGTGEILFHKVVNGFLPELFRRWDEIGAHHLVSIIMFTRMEYDQPLVASLEPLKDEVGALHTGYGADKPRHKDFYRVLISDMAYGQWSAIIEQLKRDFKTFLRDVTIVTSDAANPIFTGRESLSESFKAHTDIISGRPTSASQGNILEAINVASSQFSGDYIDRDLMRTGLSIVVITPGTGVFEVDYNLLSFTTDKLIENGVGIDLVCLSRMPLHSVPLFKYRKSEMKRPADPPRNRSAEPVKLGTQGASFESVRSNASSLLSSSRRKSDFTGMRNIHPYESPYADPWLYAIPHWLDVSFWAPHNELTQAGGSLQSRAYAQTNKVFVPRVKMYEVQMMGIMETEMSNIALPYLKLPKPDSSETSTQDMDLRSRPSMLSFNSGAKSQKSLDPSAASSYSAAPSRASSPVYHNLKAFGNVFDWIDQHDETVFSNDSQRGRRLRHAVPEINKRPPIGRISRSSLSHQYHSQANHGEEKFSGNAYDRETTAGRASKGVKSPTGSIRAGKTGQRAKLPRQLSVGFRGIGSLITKATPVTEISSASALFDSANAKVIRPISSQSKAISTQSLNDAVDPSRVKFVEINGDTLVSDISRPNTEPTQPIAIKQGNKETTEYSDASDLVKMDDQEQINMLQEKLPGTKETQSASMQLGLSPQKAMAPWLTVLNPCNPSSNYYDPRKRLGRWHHLFPRPLHATHVKWKSLCSPASVPLTTEAFPTPEQLATEYDESDYTVKYSKEGNLREDETSGTWLPRELISARFSHGFQVVLSDVAAQYFHMQYARDFSLFDDSRVGTVGSQIVLSRGLSIHRLATIDDGLVEVRILTRRPTEDRSQKGADETLVYRPAVRTTLSDVYQPREVTIATIKEAYDWERLDNFIGGREAQRNNTYPNLLNFWRARYVLIPVERPSNQKRRNPAINQEDNEEEIRLEGIKKLTQLWQKHRYLTPEERKSEIIKRGQESNPLDIIYRTMKPSAIVAAEMNILDKDSKEGKPEILPESDLFEKSNLNLHSLAQTIQGERGIRITNRRWHWRLHYNCFIGMDLTTWLLNNVRDIDTREEAVDLGNELMQQGMFVHVERRHNFRDGNFFFQITNDYLARKESRGGWFGRSIPTTPMNDSTRNQIVPKSRAGMSEDQALPNEAQSMSKKKLGAALSRSIVYDVDHRHRSYRPELMVLHYDSISSADDCYHLRIDWMNVTPKLIEDAISNWASLAERNGLRLVELPIAEASKINEFHPFRGPYPIKLAKSPPEKQPQTYFDATSLLPKPSPQHIYQEAILRKFNFVLDLEAAKDFPASVDVSYSWGKPEYNHVQYISRTGVILAQITDAGDFLLLANRLYNNRGGGVNDPQRNQRTAQHDVDHHHSPARQPATRQLASPRGSPYPSPMVRAIPDVGPGTAKLDAVTPEQIKDELEAFCHDADKLEYFYDEILRQTSTPGPMTPTMDSIVTALAAPPALSLQEDIPEAVEIES